MEYIEKKYRGLSLVLTLNWDRLVVVGVIMAAFYAGAYLAGH